ncbi:hypothetical protein SNE40_022445 [Patella caerulea]|uniref:Protein transport protein Sec61 subunit beta n=1 Tax=Patella caerulea TaxID=87958 RepID=A0AAN8G830_PATCE
MPLPSGSSTSVGAGGRAAASAKSLSPRSGGTVARQRKPGSTPTASSRKTAGSSAGMWKFYTEDSPGIKVGPVPVLVMSLLFIASVFMLHIWGKYTRS